MQAIYDLVGDKIREVFDAQVVAIAMFDEATGPASRFLYVIERGERLPIEPARRSASEARAREPRAAADR